MKFHVYILYSLKYGKYYIGQTSDLKKRLARHNSGTEKATAPYAPWKMVWSVVKPSRSEAMALEKKLKNLSKERIGLFIKKYS